MKNLTIPKDFYIIILILISFSIFFIITGTASSGFHFADDHESMKITKDLTEGSFINVTTKWINYDLDSRFRPLYYVHRVLESKLFGNNYINWSIYNIFLLFITLICFYVGLRKLKYSIIESIIFLVIIFIGRQTAVWWRFGPNERIGMLFLGLAFFFMANCEKKYQLNTALFCFCLILASLSKESFLIIVPAFLLFKIWHEKNSQFLTIKKTLLKNILLIVPMLVIITNLFIIIHVIGTDKANSGSAGVDGKLIPLINGILSIIIYQFGVLLIVLSLFFIILWFYLRNINNFLTFLKKLLYPFTICLLIVTPNLILYSKSGMTERYMLPSLVGVAFFIVTFIKETNSRKIKNLYIIILLIVSVTPASQAFGKACDYTKEGNQNKMLFSTIINNYKDTTNVLLVANPVNSFEWTSALNTYLSLSYNIKIYAYAIDDFGSKSDQNNFESNLTSTWYSWFIKRMYSDMHGKPKIILFFNKALAERFFNESGLCQEKYTNKLNVDTNYAVFIEK